MKGFLYGFVLGMLAGITGLLLVQQKSTDHLQAQQPYKQAVDAAITNAIRTASSMSDALHAKQDALGLRADQIRDELKTKGEVVRRRSQEIDEQAINDVSDARAVTEIKSKYALDPALSGRNISIRCTQGHLSLSGMVSSLDDVGEAIAIALNEDGVRDATSTLAVSTPEVKTNE
jgi:hypothetical protein